MLFIYLYHGDLYSDLWKSAWRGPETLISSCTVTPLVIRHRSIDMLLILATTLSWNKIKYKTHEL